MTSTPRPSVSARADEAEPSLNDVVHGTRSAFQQMGRPLRGRTRFIIALAIVTSLLSLAGSFLLQPRYDTHITFFVDRASSKGSLPMGLAGLGSSLGISLDDQGTQPLAFYGWLATSDPVLRQLLLDTIPVGQQYRALEGKYGNTTWGQFIGDAEPGDSVKLAKAIKKLDDLISVSVDNTTSLLTVSVSGPTSPLAQWAANQIFQHVVDANTNTRQTRAAREVVFLEGQRKSASAELSRHEADLRRFYEKNRSFQLDPALIFQEARMKRDLSEAADAYLSISRSVRDAELRAVRDVPALTLIEGPVLPPKRSRPNRALLMALGLLLGGCVAYAVLWRRYRRFSDIE